MLAKLDVRRGETIEERLAGNARAAHLRKHVVTQVQIARVDLPNVLCRRRAQLERLSADGSGGAQRHE
jgi:hypothetical protein